MSKIFHPVYDWWLEANLFDGYGKFLIMLKNRLMHPKADAFRQSMVGGF